MERRSYKQLSLEERCQIAQFCQSGQTCRQIAATLDRAASTISRELKRNLGAQLGYKPAYAAEQAWARRWRGSRMERLPHLRDLVLSRLAQGHSPVQVAGRLRQEKSPHRLSAESIYRFIYAQIRRHNDTDWRNYLPRRKYKRGYRRPAKQRSPSSLIPFRVPLSQRPAEVLQRNVTGHWEADLMLFREPHNVLLVAQERSSRLLIITRHNCKAADVIAAQLKRNFTALPAALRQSITFDNGAEFTLHHQLLQALGMKTYFCDPRAPWQKGGIENAIGRLRRFLPRNVPTDRLSQNQLNLLLARYNHTPRKCLGFLTPVEFFSSELMHFKCESTPRLRSG